MSLNRRHGTEVNVIGNNKRAIKVCLQKPVKRCVSIMRSRHNRKYVKELSQSHAAKLSLIRI